MLWYTADSCMSSGIWVNLFHSNVHTMYTRIFYSLTAVRPVNVCSKEVSFAFDLPPATCNFSTHLKRSYKTLTSHSHYITGFSSTVGVKCTINPKTALSVMEALLTMLWWSLWERVYYRYKKIAESIVKTKFSVKIPSENIICPNFSLSCFIVR